MLPIAVDIPLEEPESLRFRFIVDATEELPLTKLDNPRIPTIHEIAVEAPPDAAVKLFML
jgi:hypothetical protein